MSGNLDVDLCLIGLIIIETIIPLWIVHIRSSTIFIPILFIFLWYKTRADTNRIQNLRLFGTCTTHLRRGHMAIPLIHLSISGHSASYSHFVIVRRSTTSPSSLHLLLTLSRPPSDVNSIMGWWGAASKLPSMKILVLECHCLPINCARMIERNQNWDW